MRKRITTKAIEYPEAAKLARDCAKKGDWRRMLGCAGNNQLAFFYDNRKWFEDRGLYEAGLLYAWNHQKVTLHWRQHIKILLVLGNREMFEEASDPLPEGDEFTVYRGITDYKGEIHGVPIAGEVRGVSWSLNPETARRFAWETGKIYATKVKREDIYAYLGRPESEGETLYRREEEVMVILKPDHDVWVHEEVGETQQ